MRSFLSLLTATILLMCGLVAIPMGISFIWSLFSGSKFTDEDMSILIITMAGFIASIFYLKSMNKKILKFQEKVIKETGLEGIVSPYDNHIIGPIRAKYLMVNPVDKKMILCDYRDKSYAIKEYGFIKRVEYSTIRASATLRIITNDPNYPSIKWTGSKARLEQYYDLLIIHFDLS